MAEGVHKAITDYEQKVHNGNITTFIVKIAAKSLLLHPEPANTEETRVIPLSEELHTTLMIFFSDIEAITYNSFDYTTLLSLLNAHEIFGRMAHMLPGNSDSK